MSLEGKPQLPSINTSIEEEATGAIYQVIKEFRARLEDELTLHVGDKVEVISDDKEYNDGWYMGKSLTTGAVGLYPKAFTQLIPSLSRPSLLRSRSRRIASPVSTPSQHSPIPNKQVAAISVSNKGSRFDEYPKPLLTLKDDEPSVVSNALSDIDKALEELRTDAGATELDDKRTSFSGESKESLNPESVDSWSPEQVTSYFSYLGFDAGSAGQFAKHKITGAILLELELAYLKELDISSFGTRFEIFKEIEALKELAKQRKALGDSSYEEISSLQAPPELYRDSLSSRNKIDDDLDTFTRPLGHTRRKSRSLDDIPETKAHLQSPIIPQTLMKSTHPPSSQIPQVPKSPLEDQFLSPRRAPQPPSYPSPIQLRDGRTSSQSTPIANKRQSYYEGQSKTHSRRPSYDVNPAFQFSHSRKPSAPHSRNGSRTLKSASAADLLSTMDGGRPASSVYLDPHSRQSSVNLRSNGHTRRSSEASVLKSEREEKAHRRHSSVFSFLSPSRDKSPTRPTSMLVVDSPTKLQYKQVKTPQLQQTSPLSPTKDRRSVSAKESEGSLSSNATPPTKRSISEAVRTKTLRTMTTAKQKSKKETSAFMEGIKNVSPSESIKTAECFGWMAKRGGIAVGVWKQRYFTLHGTRLSYFSSLNDTRERGLIDITSHKVLPARDDDKLVSLYAASTGNGKFCFKLVPPAPGSRKGLTFTQPKVHYFAVETKEEMRAWMAALIKATIDIDESVPVLSSCATPTVSLQKAQLLLAQARENVKRRDDIVKSRDAEGRTEFSGNSSVSPDSDSFDSSTIPQQSPNTTAATSDVAPMIAHESNGFASPFEMASNSISTKSAASSATQSPIDTEFKSKPYNPGMLRHPSQRVLSASQAAAQAALGYKSGGKI
jgi:hypothetical protein